MKPGKPRVLVIQRFELRAYAILAFMLFLMLGACAKDEPYHKYIDIPPEVASPTATYDGRHTMIPPRIAFTSPTRPVRPAAS